MYLRSIARTEGVDSASFVSLKHVNVGLDDRADLERARLADNQTSIDLISIEASHQDTYIVTGFSVVKSLVKGLDTDTLRLEIFIITIKFKIVSEFDGSLLDSSAGNGSSTGYAVGAFHCHEEGFVNWPSRHFDLRVHSVEESLDTLFSQLRFGVLQVTDGRAPNKSRFLWIVVMFFKELLEFELNEVHHVGFLDHIHLVEEDQDVANSNLSAEKDVFLGLGHGSIHSRDNQNTCVHFGSSGDHVLDVIDMSGAVNVSVVSSFGFILDGGSVDGDTSCLFFGSLVDGTVLDVFGFGLVGQIFGDGGCECGLAVVDVSNGAD